MLPLLEKCSWLLLLPLPTERHLPGAEKGRKKIHGRPWQEDSKFYCSLRDWKIQEASQQPFIYSARQSLLHTRTFLQKLTCTHWFDSCCSGCLVSRRKGWFLADRMTWSHVELLLVIGSFLFRHYIEGHVERQVSRAGLKEPDLVVGLLRKTMLKKFKVRVFNWQKFQWDMVDMAFCQFESNALYHGWCPAYF